MGRYFLGKRVACLSKGERDGLWAEYAVASTKGGAFPLNKSVSLEQGAMSIINPLTASAFIEIAKDGGHKAIVLTAAASALGQMVNRLGRSKGIQIINVVRRDAQVEHLNAQGSTVVLNSTDVEFASQLHDACHQYDATLAFDAVAGPMTGQLLKALPENSTVMVYSCLSHEAPQTNVDQIIFRGKTITGFWLGPWLYSNKNLAANPYALAAIPETDRHRSQERNPGTVSVPGSQESCPRIHPSNDGWKAFAHTGNLIRNHSSLVNVLEGASEDV